MESSFECFHQTCYIYYCYICPKCVNFYHVKHIMLQNISKIALVYENKKWKGNTYCEFSSHVLKNRNFKEFSFYEKRKYF